MSLSFASYTRERALAPSPSSCRVILDCLENIVRFSRKGLKQEETLRKLSQASSFSRRLFALTARKSKHFGYLNGRLTPKEVLCPEVEDDFSTYENRFAKFILTELFAELNAASSAFRRDSSLLPILGKGLDYSKFGNALPIIDYAEDAYRGKQREKLSMLEELLSLRGEASGLLQTGFFLSVEPIREQDVHLTNALAYDPLYGTLYKAYASSRRAYNPEADLNRIVADFSSGRQKSKKKGIVRFAYSDFSISIEKKGEGLLIKGENAFDSSSRSYFLLPRPSFFYPRYDLLSEAGEKTTASLFGAIDSSLPLKLLFLTLPSYPRYCPICGGLREGGHCHECGALFGEYDRDGERFLWVYDLPFRGKENGYEAA